MFYLTIWFRTCYFNERIYFSGLWSYELLEKYIFILFILFFNFTLFSDSALLCILFIYIVGNLISKFFSNI